MINKICRDVIKVQDLVNSISTEFQLPHRIQAESGPTQDGQRRQNLEEQLRDTNGFLKQIGDWLVAFAKMSKNA